MAVAAHIVHHIPGRVRLRVPHRRDHHGFFAEVHQRLETCPNVTGISTNPATASILVRYKGELAEVLGQAAAVGIHELLEMNDGLPPVPQVVGALLGRLAHADSQITERTSGSLDGRSTVLLVLIAAGIVQLLRGQVLGPAMPLLWYAAQAIGLPTRPGKPAS